MNPISIINRLIRYNFYLLFFLVPLLLTTSNYELFEFNKMIATYLLAAVIVSLWVVKMGLSRKIILRRTFLDIPILAFTISQLVSSLFSMDPHVSWFGYYSRFNGGMLSVITYVLLFYALVSNWQEAEQDKSKSETALNSNHLRPIIYSMLASTIFICTYGILQHFGIDKHIWVQDVKSRIFSTLGQPNWLAAYLVALLPIPLALALAPKSLKKPNFQSWILNVISGGLNQYRLLIFTALYLFLFITLLYTKSRSGLLGYACTTLVFFLGIGYFFLKKYVDQLYLLKLIGIHLLAAVVLFFTPTGIDQLNMYFSPNALQRLSAAKTSSTPTTVATASAETNSGTMLESGGTESGTIRKYVWEGAITAWKSSQKTWLIGTGTETFAFAFFKYKPIAHNLTSEWDFLYNKAHNEYLNYLTTTGIIGFSTYLIFLSIIIIWSFLSIVKSKLTPNHVDAKKSQNLQLAFTYESYDQYVLFLALFAGWISLLVTNFFGFSVVIIQIFLFLFPAILILIQANLHPNKHLTYTIPLNKKTGIIISSFAAVAGIIGIIAVLAMWLGDYYFSQGYRQSRAGQLANAYKSISTATFFRPREPLYYDELGVVLGGLSIASLEAGNATVASEFAKQSVAANDIALSVSPNNVNFWKTRTKIYFGFASVDPTFVEASLNALKKAYELSPVDPKISYNIAVLEGRLGNNEKAIDLLKQTIMLKPNYRDAYFALNIFYQEVKQPALAKAIIEEYLKKVDPNDQGFKDIVNNVTKP